MRDTKKQPAITALRHLLTAAGAIAIARGVATQSQITELVGAIPALIGPLWDMADEYLAARQVDDDARLKSAVDAAVTAALAARATLPRTEARGQTPAEHMPAFLQREKAGQAPGGEHATTEQPATVPDSPTKSQP